MLHTSSISMALLKVQEALEEKFHLLGRQLHVDCTLKQAPDSLLVSLAYLLQNKPSRSAQRDKTRLSEDHPSLLSLDAL